MCFDFSSNEAKLVLREMVEQMKYDPIRTFALSKTNKSTIAWLKQKYSWISRLIKRFDVIVRSERWSNMFAISNSEASEIMDW